MSDDGEIQKEIIRPEEFDFNNPSARAAFMNEVRDIFRTINFEVSKKKT